MRADVDPINATNFHTENLFGLFVTQGLEDPSHNMAYLLQGGLGMPSRDYYLSQDPQMAAFRAKYQTYVASLLKLAGTPTPMRKRKPSSRWKPRSHRRRKAWSIARMCTRPTTCGARATSRRKRRA